MRGLSLVIVAVVMAALLISCKESTPAAPSDVSETGPVGDGGQTGPGRFSTGSGRMKADRQSHSATLLKDGRVLTAGGRGEGHGNYVYYYSVAEVYDPGSKTWTPTGSMSEARKDMASALLPDGRVLVAGGVGDHKEGLKSAEVWDPETGTWSLSSKMSVGRERPEAVVLQDGRVMVIGGKDPLFRSLDSSDVYDPIAGTWTETSAMAIPRYLHRATRLADGRVLVVGGGKRDGPYLDSGEVYDPATDTWS